MSCQIRSEEHTGNLLAYAAGKLRGEAATNLEAHMFECKDCAAFGSNQKAVWDLLDNWQGPEVSPSFDRRLYARIEAAESASWYDRMLTAVNEFLRPVLARPAFPLAAAALVIVGGFVLNHPGKMFNSTSQQASLHIVSMDNVKVEVDQVEATLEDMEMLRQFDAKSDEALKDSSSKSM